MEYDYKSKLILICLQKIEEEYKNQTNVQERFYKELNYLDNEQCEWLLHASERITKNQNGLGGIFFPRLRMANSLILHLLNLNIIDPIKYKLDYELFYENLPKDGVINLKYDCNSKVLYPLKLEGTKVSISCYPNENLDIIYKLLKQTHKKLSDINFDIIVDKFIDESKIHKKEGLIEYSNIEDIEEFNHLDYFIGKMDINNINDLVSAISILHGTNTKRNYLKIIEVLGSECGNLPTNQDNLYKLLIKFGMSKSDAIRLSKESSLSKPLSNNDVNLLKSIKIDDAVIDFVDKCLYLIPYGHILSKVYIGIYQYYFKCNYPKLFEKQIMVKNKNKGE